MSGTAITSIHARQVYTNRGNPGVEAVVTTENGAVGRAMCTSGISVGTHEIVFSFDGGATPSLQQGAPPFRIACAGRGWLVRYRSFDRLLLNIAYC